MLSRKSIAAILLATTTACTGPPPFESKDRAELTAKVNMLYPPGTDLAAAIADLEKKGFSCSDEHDASVQALRPRGPNGELPYHCAWGRSTIPFVCGESWLVVLVPDDTTIATASAGYHDACL